MAEQDKKVSGLVSVDNVGAGDLVLATIVDQQEESGYSSRRITLANFARCILNVLQFPLLITKTTATTVIGALNEIAYKEITDTLEAGETSLTISDASITTSSTVDIFTDAFGVVPEDVTISTGSIVLTFEEQEEDLGVKVRVW